MATKTPDRLTITPEFFLEPLRLPAVPGGLPERRLELFAAIVQDLQERGLADTAPARSTTPGACEMNLMIPGTVVHVHLSAVGDPQVTEMLQVVTALEVHHLQGVLLTLVGLRKLTRLFTSLKTEYGERSVVEALRQTQPNTALGVAGVLHGAACRHSSARCRFMGDDGTCKISTNEVAETLKSLVARQVLVVQNAAEPHEYKIAF